MQDLFREPTVGSQKYFSAKSYRPRRPAEHRSAAEIPAATDSVGSRQTHMQFEPRQGREKIKRWSVHSFAVSARRRYNTAVSTRTTHVQFMYRRTPVSTGNTFQDLRLLRESRIIPNGIYRVSYELRSLLRESVPYVKIYRYNPKHLYPKLHGYGDNGQRKVWTSCISAYFTSTAVSRIDLDRAMQ